MLYVYIYIHCICCWQWQCTSILLFLLGFSYEEGSDLCFYTFAGIDNNETIKVFRSGGADPDGDHPGDLYVTIKVLK